MWEMEALSGVFSGDKELGWPISTQCGHAAFESLRKEQKELLTFLLKRKNQ